jgi:hypothetical protein
MLHPNAPPNAIGTNSSGGRLLGFTTLPTGDPNWVPGRRWRDFFVETKPGKWYHESTLGNFSSCRRCLRTWAYVDPYSVQVTEHCGFFALCCGCWKDSTTGARVRFYLLAHDEYENDKVYSREQLEAAVRKQSIEYDGG